MTWTTNNEIFDTQKLLSFSGSNVDYGMFDVETPEGERQPDSQPDSQTASQPDRQTNRQTESLKRQMLSP